MSPQPGIGEEYAGDEDTRVGSTGWISKELSVIQTMIEDGPDEADEPSVELAARFQELVTEVYKGLERLRRELESL